MDDRPVLFVATADSCPCCPLFIGKLNSEIKPALDNDYSNMFRIVELKASNMRLFYLDPNIANYPPGLASKINHVPFVALFHGADWNNNVLNGKYYMLREDGSIDGKPLDVINVLAWIAECLSWLMPRERLQ